MGRRLRPRPRFPVASTRARCVSSEPGGRLGGEQECLHAPAFDRGRHDPLADSCSSVGLVVHHGSVAVELLVELGDALLDPARALPVASRSAGAALAASDAVAAPAWSSLPSRRAPPGRRGLPRRHDQLRRANRTARLLSTDGCRRNPDQPGDTVAQGSSTTTSQPAHTVTAPVPQGSGERIFAPFRSCRGRCPSDTTRRPWEI